MKTFSNTSIFVITVTVMMLSCQKQETQKDVAPRESVFDSAKRLGISSNAAQALACGGYSLTDVKASDKYLILESDLIVDKSGLELDVSNNKNGRQYATDAVGIVDFSRVTNVKYFVHSSVANIPTHGAGWVSAINQATQDWSSLYGVAVRFNSVSDLNQADIVFYSDNTSNSGVLPACAIGLPYNPPAYVFAASAFPTNGQVGRFISINDDDTFTNDVGKRWVIRHELGHALGNRHSDMYQRLDGIVEPANGNGCGGAITGGNLLLNTPTRDLNSVMISASDGTTDINFDNDDIRAAQLLYPYLSGPIQPIQMNSASYSGSTLSVTVSSYPIAVAQLELRILRRSICGIGYCYNVVNTRRFVTSQSISWTGVSVQQGDMASVSLVNYKGDYIAPNGGASRNITM